LYSCGNEKCAHTGTISLEHLKGRDLLGDIDADENTVKKEKNLKRQVVKECIQLARIASFHKYGNEFQSYKVKEYFYQPNR
jgi:hypothetical protein